MTEPATRALVVGIGNELLGDEGFGVHVARALSAGRARLPPGIDVVEAGTALDALIGEFPRYEHLILIDAIRAGEQAGSVYCIELGDEWGEQIPASPPLSLHESGLFGTLAAAGLLGLLPRRITLLGAEPRDIAFATGLSPPLERAAARVVDLLAGLLPACQCGASHA